MSLDVSDSPRGRRNLSAQLAALALKLPPRMQKLAARLHIARGLLARQDRIAGSPHLAHLPPAMRRARARQLLRDHLKSLPVGSHIPGFFPFLATHHPWPDFPDEIHQAGKAPPETLFEVVQPALPAPLPARRLALHVHAFYLDGLPGILERIALNRSMPDLIVTGPEAQAARARYILAHYPGRAEYRAVPNIGRDVVPFLDLLPELLAGGYDLIGHVHLKRSASHARAFADLWTEYMLAGVLGWPGRALIDDIVQDLAGRDTAPAMYFPHMATRTDWNANRAQARQLAEQFDLGPTPDRLVFSVGTMFWAAPAYLARFAAIRLDWASLLPEPIAGDGTPLHAVERLFGAVALAGGQQIVITGAPPVPFVFSRKLMARWGGLCKGQTVPHPLLAKADQPPGDISSQKKS